MADDFTAWPRSEADLRELIESGLGLGDEVRDILRDWLRGEIGPTECRTRVEGLLGRPTNGQREKRTT